MARSRSNAHSKFSSHRMGFTLIEVFVALAILAILMSVLVSAVQRARESARAIECQNRLRSLGLAWNAHADTYRFFPAAVTERESWKVRLLPFLEAMKPTVDANGKSVGGPVDSALFKCPSDPVANANSGLSVNDTAENNYRLNNGIGGLYCDGILYNRLHKPLSHRDIVDGLSNTVAASERLALPYGWFLSSPDTGLNNRRLVRKTTAFTADMNRFAIECETLSVPPIWAITPTGYYNHIQTPNRKSCTNGSPDDAVAMISMAVTAGSLHGTLVHVCLCDGSVRRTSEWIDMKVWRSLGTRNGAESLSE